MNRIVVLTLLVALAGPQCLPLAAPARAGVETEMEHHHPPGCPWQGTSDCPHDHPGPSSDPAWLPCAGSPIAVAGEVRMAWAPPSGMAGPSMNPTNPSPVSVPCGDRPPSDPPTDVEIPPPQNAAAD